MKNSFKIILALILLGLGWVVLNPKVHADTYNWQQQLQTNPNQYWNMNYGKPTIQRMNDKREITYYIQAGPRNPYYKAWQYAINKYNQLGVVKLVVTNYQNAQIRLMGKYNMEKASELSDYNAKPDLDGAYGMTYYGIISDGDKNAYYNQVTCRLSVAMAFGGDDKMYRAVAEHELGHALGFDHNDNKINGKYMVMSTGHDIAIYKKDIPQPIGAYEKQALIDHYGQP